MKKFVFVTFLTLFLTACGETESSPSPEPEASGGNDPIQVVATFSIIADMVYQVGGSLVEIYTIVPIGEEPEEHEILPSDMIAVSTADIIFYNGLGLEEGGYWFEDLVEATGIVAGVDFFSVSQGVVPFNLQTEGLEDYYDPHAWLDISKGIIYIQNITNILSDFAPTHADTFEANAAAEIARLQELHDTWVGAFNDIPASQRIVVTAEGALRYMASAYGFDVGYIWELNAEEEGTIEQMIRIIEFVNASDINYLFIESSIEPDYIEQVSEETGVPIFGMLFTDSLSYANEEAPTYFEMMRHNLELINAAFRSN